MRLDRCPLAGPAPAERKTGPLDAGMAMAFSSRRVPEGRVLALEVVGKSAVLNPLKPSSPYSTFRSDGRRGLFAGFVVVFVVVFTAFICHRDGGEMERIKNDVESEGWFEFVS